MSRQSPASSSNRRAGRTKKPNAPIFAIPADNAGTIAWRRNEEPQADLPFRRGSNFNRQKLHQIALETGTYIQASPTARKFFLWGAPEQVAKAKSLLEIEIGETNQVSAHGRKDGKWARMPSLTPEARRIQEKELDIEEIKQAFRRDPPSGAVFESTGNFVWPSDACRPEDLFGYNIQGLDPIRIDCSCYITYDRHAGTFRAMGKRVNVLTAIVRIRATLFQEMATRLRASKSYLLHWRDVDRIPERIGLINYQHTRIMIPSKLIPLKPLPFGVTPRGRGRLSKTEIEKRPDPEKHLTSVAKKIKDQIMEVLNKIRYFRGPVTMQARLGTFILDRYLRVTGNGYTLFEFEKMIQKDVVFEGFVTHELGDRQLEEKALGHLTNAKGFLETQSTFVHELSDVQPIYTATLTLDPNDGAGFMQLRKSWKEEDGAFVVQNGASWYRLRHHSATERHLLETCVVEIDDGLAWQFEMLARKPIVHEMVPQPLQVLGEYHFNIKPKEARNMREHRVWCEFEKDEEDKPRLVPRKQTLHLRIAWEFGITGSGYVVEVAKTQDVQYETTPKTLVGKEEAIVFEPRWTVQVRHQNWEVNLAENANLEMGKGAQWRADLETWFPVDDFKDKKGGSESKTNGHLEMMEKLFKVMAIIRGEG